MWSEKTRSWRKKGKRAVSPIIATILLVAITVVLAAVLYILISGLTKGPGNTPLGTEFGWGDGQKITGPVGYTLVANGCVAGDQCYVFSITPGNGIVANNLAFQIKNTLGAVQTFSAVTLMDVKGSTQAQYTTANGWSTAVPAACPAGDVCFGNAPMTNSMTLILDTGVTPAVTYSGYSFSAVGQGTYSGAVTTTLS